ncbi:GNAT family N-acetyltransferase [Paraburkholderia acidicola]|uniref:GNAT family N-acetyltransferase n=1 Tax=Paraburkholderia acidicola TaxID=1912599 RepID=A0A2A4ESZ2_9BURK|nr:GNAT family N-acetyltransferase [Paraburkholderia acidicola]PCE23219.1 GNAT family N-acetyltransferase [Paraburkholderia acidicola]
MNTDQVVIKPLTIDDADAFKALRLHAIQDAPASFWPTYEEEARLAVDDVRNRIRPTENQVVFGAFSGTGLIGVTGLRRESLEKITHNATLWGVFVEPEWRRSGVARMLLEAAVTHARETKVLQIRLFVHTENPRAQQLYRSVGFVSYGIEQRAIRVGDRFYDEEHMMLRLDE